jgi:Domain of unknown function (DUF4412)
MKRFLYSVVIALAALNATAGITYDFRSVTSGMQASEQAGHVIVDGGNMRLEFKSGDGTLFRNGAVAISHNGGSTIDVLDPQSKTFWELDLTSLNASALAGMVKMTNEKVNVRDAGDGGTIEGFPTRHKVITASADMNIGAQAMRLELTMETWTTDKIPADAASFLQRRLGSTGFPMLDKLITAQTESVKGFPLRQVTSMKVGQGSGALIEMSSTTNVTNVQKTNVAAAQFVVPGDYKKTASPMDRMMGQ